MDDYVICLLKLVSCINRPLIRFIEDLLFGHDERLSHDSEFSYSACYGRSFSTIDQSPQDDCSMCPEHIDASTCLVEHCRRPTHLNEDLSENQSSGLGGIRRTKSFISQWLTLPLCGLRLGCRLASTCLRYSCLYVRNIRMQVFGDLRRIFGGCRELKNYFPWRMVQPRFMELLNDIRNGKHCLPNSLIYLLIPGLFSNHSPSYFVNTKRFFSKMGLTSHIAKIHSEVYSGICGEKCM